MDSGSDWDSLSGDTDINATADKVNECKEIPAVENPLVAIKSPKTGSPQKKSIISSPNYGVNQTTVFANNKLEDFGEIPPPDGFKNGYFQDESYIEKQMQRRTQKTSKNSLIQDHLPYTSFKANDSPLQISKKKKKSSEGNRLKKNNQSHVLSNNNVLNGDSYIDIWMERSKELSRMESDGNEEQVVSTENAITEIEKRRYFNTNQPYEYYYMSFPDDAFMPKLAKRIEPKTKRFWREVFGALHIFVDFFLVFIVELVTFVSRVFVQRFAINIIDVISEAVFKPMLFSLFNSFIQPVFVFIWNVAMGTKKIVQPCADILGNVLEPFVALVRSFRLFHYSSIKT